MRIILWWMYTTVMVVPYLCNTHFILKCWKFIYERKYILSADLPAFQRRLRCSWFELKVLAKLWDSSRQSSSWNSWSELRYGNIPWSSLGVKSTVISFASAWSHIKSTKTFHTWQQLIMHQSLVTNQVSISRSVCCWRKSIQHLWKMQKRNVWLHNVRNSAD